MSFHSLDMPPGYTSDRMGCVLAWLGVAALGAIIAVAWLLKQG